MQRVYRVIEYIGGEEWLKKLLGKRLVDSADFLHREGHSIREITIEGIGDAVPVNTFMHSVDERYEEEN